MPPAFPWQSGLDYTVIARATDKAGNVQISSNDFTVTVNSVTFTFDNSNPTVYIQDPSDPDVGFSTNPRLSALGVISGTAEDAAGLNRVEIRIRRDPDTGPYWDGSGFLSVPSSWNAIPGLSSTTASVDWSYSGVTWENDRTYRM